MTTSLVGRQPGNDDDVVTVLVDTSIEHWAVVIAGVLRKDKFLVLCASSLFHAGDRSIRFMHSRPCQGFHTSLIECAAALGSIHRDNFLFCEARRKYISKDAITLLSAIIDYGRWTAGTGIYSFFRNPRQRHI
jgi:hypothetical protein